MRREIGPIRKRVDPTRRRKTLYDYGAFCRTYFPAGYTLPWSENHLLAAERIEYAVLKGGLFAFAMPRGSGKTTMCEWAALWALCHAHRKFVMVIGATAGAAEDRLKSIRIELANNDLLYEDFPEICQAIRGLGSSWRVPEGQTSEGRSTLMEWKKDRIVFPTVRKRNGRLFETSGSVLHVAGLTGEIRGKTAKLADGRVIRPDFAIPDDPQTSESARSPSQSMTRANLLAADVAYLAGPGNPIAVVVPCTVICKGDMADRILDREIHPEYRGIRTKMVKHFPTNMVLWDQYGSILKDSWRNDGDGSEATEFYRLNREKMDDGFEVTWPERKGADEVSAEQHAMNLYYRDQRSFFSEMQNDPVEQQEGDADLTATPDDVLGKVCGMRQYICQSDAMVVTGMIDVKFECLHWILMAWAKDFDGLVIDYGIWPKQPHRILDPKKLVTPLDVAYPGRVNQRIYAALTDCADHIFRRYPVDGGGELQINRLLVDANLGQTSNTVYQWCRAQEHGSRVIPWHGKYVGAKTTPWSSLKKKKGERRGDHWRELPSENHPIRHILGDVNHWKTIVHAAMKAPFGDGASIRLYGRYFDDRQLPERHHLEFADQFCAEYAQLVTAGENSVVEFSEKPGSPANEALDLVVGAAVAANMEGIEIPGNRSPHKKRKIKTVSMQELYAQSIGGKRQ